MKDLKFRIGIVEYGSCNRGSLIRGFSRSDIEVVFTDDPYILKSCNGIVLPGVGHYATAHDHLTRAGIWEILEEAENGKIVPIMGICLGMQLMALSSEEALGLKGLGWIQQQTVSLEKINFFGANIGWRRMQLVSTDSFNLSGAMYGYFCHRYVVPNHGIVGCKLEINVAEACVALFNRDNVFGVQFHPEVSSCIGRRVIDIFLDRVRFVGQSRLIS